MGSSSGIATASISLSRLRGMRVSWPLLLGLTAFLMPVFVGWGLMDPDTYWHIAAGRWMLGHGYVPTRDPFSFTMHGTAWVAHEWGAELLIALCYRTAGWSALVFLAAACYAVTIAYLTRFLLRRMEPLHALLLTLLAASMMFPSVLARPHDLVWPLTAVWVGTLVGASEHHRAPPWWLLGMMLLWANMHASFILGLALAVALGVETVVNETEERKRVARRWTLFVLAAFACALVNPHGYHLLVFPFQVLGLKSLDHISEWQAPNLQQPQFLSLWLLVILGLAFIGRIRLPLVRLIVVLGLMFMALQHIRNIALLGLISPLFLAKPVATLWRHAPPIGRDASVLDRWFAALALPAGVTAASATLVLACVTAVAVLTIRRPHPLANTTPGAALDALFAKRKHVRIFNDYDFGGYLIYRGVPVFVDGRVDLYGDSFFGHMFDALTLSQGGDLQGLLRQYRINEILLRPGWPAVRLLDRLPEWQRVYADKVAVAYIRRSTSIS